MGKGCQTLCGTGSMSSDDPGRLVCGRTSLVSRGLPTPGSFIDRSKSKRRKFVVSEIK
jgi:hypothetical protein